MAAAAALNRALRLAFLLPLAAVLLWLAGLVWFMTSITRPAEMPLHADGIVALTGGAERVETALRLLADGHAPLLLISGVGPDSSLHDLARHSGIEIAGLAERITLGRAATTTRGNADETAAWAHAHGIRTLIVVTADYHMPRALEELQRMLPEVDMLPAPVTPPALRGRPDWPTLRLVALEYTKWLGSGFGLSGWSRSRARHGRSLS